LPEGKRALHNKCTYWLKEPNGTERYKTRMVVKEFQQQKGIDFKEIFSLIVKLTTIRSILSIVAT